MTSVAALAIFVGLGLYSGDVLRDPAFELNCFLTRQRVLRGRGGHAGLSQHLRRGVRIALAAQAERTATIEDRLRLARDLHDGLLQLLTGTALQLETARRRVETDPQTVGGSLIDIQGLLAAKQRALRTGRRRQGWPPR